MSRRASALTGDSWVPPAWLGGRLTRLAMSGASSQTATKGAASQADSGRTAMTATPMAIARPTPPAIGR